MKKQAVLAGVFVLVCLTLFGCGKKTTAPKAGSASPEDMLSLVPVDAQGVVFIDMNKAMTTEFANKAIEKDKGYQKYKEFIEATGIDPQKDVYFVTVAITGKLEGAGPEGAAVVNMRYDKETLLNLAKEKAQEEGTTISEVDYHGVALYSWAKEGADKEEAEEEHEHEVGQEAEHEEEFGEDEDHGEDKDMDVAFIDDSNIVAGEEAAVKSVIDVLQGRKQNVFKNQALSEVIAQSNKQAMVWGSILLSKEAKEKMRSENPMLSDLMGISAVAMFFDLEDKDILAEIKMMNQDAEKNTKIAETLTGFKALGSLAAGKKPEIGELMDRIEITAAADHIRVFCRLPEELLSRLTQEEDKTEN